MKHFQCDDIPAQWLNDKFVRKLARTGVEQGYVVRAHSTTTRG